MVIKCPECNHFVSDTSSTCPHCGYVLKKEAAEEPKPSMPEPEPVAQPEPEVVQPEPAPVAPEPEPEPEIQQPAPAPVAPQPIEYQEAEKSNGTLYVIISVLAVIICAALWFGIKGCSDDKIDIQLLQAQPANWDKFVSPKSSSASIYEQPDISQVLLKTDQNSILPVLDETENFYKVYMGEGREGWVKKNQWQHVAVEPINKDILPDFFLKGERLNSIMHVFHEGPFKGLVLFYYRDFTSADHLEVGLLLDGRLIQPQNHCFDAVALNERGFNVVTSTDGGNPKIEFGANYQINNDDFKQYPKLSELSNKQLAEIWKAAQGANPNMVLVAYCFPEQKTIRYYDIDLNVYGVDNKSSKINVVEGEAGLSDFKYVIDSQYDSMLEKDVYSLYALTPSGEKVSTNTSDPAIHLNIIAQGDFDGDEIPEAIVYEWGGGNLIEPPYIVYYDKDDNIFKKVNGFDIDYSNEEFQIEEWKGQTTFVATIGLRKDRWAYNNHKLSLVERVVPDVGVRVATISLEKLFKANEESSDKSIYIDINGDGSTEKLTFHHDTSHALSYGNSMELVKIEADNWTIPNNENVGLGVSGKSFSFIASDDGDIPDILCNDAWLYKWDRNHYMEP